MIIVWRGNGLVGLIPLLGFPVFGVVAGILLMEWQRKIAKVLPFFDDQFAGFTAFIVMVFACFCGGLLCYLLGRGWRRKGGNHDVYFIPIDHLGLIASLASGSFLFLI